MADFDTIKQEINVNIPDNNSQYITAKKVRDTLLDMIDDVDEAKQDALVSGTNIKTINGYTLLGSGDIVIEGGGDLSAYVSKEELSQMGYVTSNYLSQASYVTSDYLSQAGYVTNEYLSQASYVTSSDLSAYVTKTELSNASYVTQNALNNMSYVTASALSNMSYATTSDLNNAIAGIDVPTYTSDLTNDSGFITASDLDGYATETYVVDYVAQHAPTPDLSAYVTKTELSNMSYVTASALSNMSYATTTQVNAKQDALVSGTNIKTINNESLLGSGNIVIEGGGDLSAYVSKVELSNMGYITASDVSQMGYVTSTALTNMSYATTSDLNNAIAGIDVPTYTSDLTNDSGFITASDLNGYATETYVADYVATHSGPIDLSAYVTKTELSAAGYLTAVPAEYVTQTELESELAQYVTESEIAAMGYVTESELNNASYVTQSALNNMSYVTSSALSNMSYATTSDLNTAISGITVPTKTSELTNDSGFITSIPAEYVTQSQLSANSYVTQSELSEMGYVTGSQLQQAGYLTSVPSEYVTESEIAGMGYVTATELSNASYATSTDLVSYLNIANFNRTVPVQLKNVGLTIITTSVPNTIAPQVLTYSQFTSLTNPWVGGSTMVNYVNEVMPKIDENIIPKENVTYTLGDSSHLYAATYTDELKLGGASIGHDGNNAVFKVNGNSKYMFAATQIIPYGNENNNVLNLGASNRQWAYTYSQNFIENGTNIKDIYTQTEVVTQAQYDALTTEEKNSETIYVISDQQAYFDNELVTEQSLSAKGYLTADNFQYDTNTGTLTLIL